MLHRFAQVLLVGSIAAVSTERAAAKQFIIPVPGHEWNVQADMPELAMFRGSTEPSGFQFQAASKDGFNISVFVEAPQTAGEGHQPCFEYYWEKMQRNPLIDGTSATVTKAGHFVRVDYVLEPLPESLPKYKTNFFLAHDGKWVDVHISLVGSEERATRVEQIAKSLEVVAVSVPE